MYFFISSRMQAILQTDNVTACERGLLGRKKKSHIVGPVVACRDSISLPLGCYDSDVICPPQTFRDQEICCGLSFSPGG